MRRAFLFAAVLMAAIPFGAVAKSLSQQSVDTYILLDRTGSMSGIWDEALGSVNAYAHDLGKETPQDTGLQTTVTLAVFDFQNGLQFDVVRPRTSPDGWRPVTAADAAPRGMTPLYDAIGQIVALAEKDNPKKAVIVIMTDGEENSSRELTQTGARAALDRARARGWEVVFLGAEFANFSDAEAVGMEASRTMAVSKDGMTATMQGLAKKNRDYGASDDSVVVTFDATDRAAANEDQVKNKP